MSNARVFLSLLPPFILHYSEPYGYGICDLV